MTAFEKSMKRVEEEERSLEESSNDDTHWEFISL